MCLESYKYAFCFRTISIVKQSVENTVLSSNVWPFYSKCTAEPIAHKLFQSTHVILSKIPASHKKV